MKKADAVSRTDPLFPHLVLGSDLAERFVVASWQPTSSVIDLQSCLVYVPRFPRRGSQVAKAELCKSSIVGSIPTLASILISL